MDIKSIIEKIVNNKDTITAILAIYAATLSTIVFVSNLIFYFRDKLLKVIVSIKITKKPGTKFESAQVEIRNNKNIPLRIDGFVLKLHWWKFGKKIDSSSLNVYSKDKTYLPYILNGQDVGN